MIFGVGVDLAKCSRFEKWVKSPEMIDRFFNPKELWQARAGSQAVPKSEMGLSAACQHYAARFAAKEAFSKALGTGVTFDLRDLWIKKDEKGKPSLCIEKSALETLKKACPQWEKARVHVSLSHEKEYAVAQVIIELP
jgi:holo-[acyl-carrier protein] synthase